MTAQLIYPAGLLRAALMSFFVAAGAFAATTETVTFNQPPLFSYLGWQNKARVDDGRLVVKANDAKGGLGVNAELNLAARTNRTPSLVLTANAGHQAKVIRVMMRDAKGGEASFDFPISSKRGEPQTIFARDAATLAEPNSRGNEGLPDFSRITQWQLIGDWSADAVDLRLDRLVFAMDSPERAADRVARAKKLRAEADAAAKKRAELKARYSVRTGRSPVIERVSLVAANIIAVDIQCGRFIPARLEQHAAHAGDKWNVRKSAKGETNAVILQRDGKDIGWLIGPQRDWLTTYEHVEGDPLLDFVAEEAGTWRISSADDAAFAPGITPVAVYRKSRANAWAQGTGELAIRHTFYLKLSRALSEGRTYTVACRELNVREPEVKLAFDSTRVRSDAVHAQQIGFRPDDPVKRAFVSCWLGTGGAMLLPQQMDFSLIDDATGAVVFRGQAERHFPANRIEKMARDANFNGTDVARCDFSSFEQPGRYRVAVAGAGCSYPFEISSSTWERAFVTQMRGLLNSRSGVELGPPYTNFRKPRDMHPADGYRVTRTTFRAVERGGEAWKEIVAGDTGERADGWGGYHDAGDWNPRRVTHMRVNMASLELFELFPDYFERLKLNTPPRAGVPDVLAEAMFEFDCFRRLQQTNGGVGYGIESKGDPLEGEVSWLNSFSSYVFAPDYAASWHYAAAGARLAGLLQKYDAPLAAAYRESASRAFTFAEQDFAREQSAGTASKRHGTWEALDARNLAALELYRLTGGDRFHHVFLEGTALKEDKPELFAWGKHVQREHAFVYARLPEGRGDAALKKKAAAALEVLAARALDYASNNAFNLTTCDKGKPQFIGFYTTPDALDLVRAHFLTGKREYLAGAVQAAQFQAGCNPNNLVYTSGLGANPVRNPFKLDSRRTGQRAPEGLTPYGNVDLAKWNDVAITWPITWIIGKVTVPDAYAWPATEAYWDLGGWPMLEEFTVDAWAPNVLVWGYLAARR